MFPFQQIKSILLTTSLTSLTHVHVMTYTMN